MCVPWNALNKRRKAPNWCTRVGKTCCSDFHKLQLQLSGALFEEGGCIVNLSWLVSGYSRYKDRLLALKNGQKSAFFSMKAVFRGDFQTILTAFPTFTHGKWKMALFRNKPLFDLENWSTGTFFFSLKNACPSCVWKWRVFNRWPIMLSRRLQSNGCQN